MEKNIDKRLGAGLICAMKTEAPLGSIGVTTDSIDTRNNFEKLSTTGRSVIREYCRARGNGDEIVGAKHLSEISGCELDQLIGFLKDSEFLLTGMEWEQLLYICIDRPESLLYRAEVDMDACNFTCAAGASDEPPSEGYDNRICRILSAITSFYQEASVRYLKRA